MLSSGMSYCSHTNALTVVEFSARRSALGTKLCLSMSVLAGVEMPSKREIIPKFLVEGACLDEMSAVSTRESLARFGGSILNHYYCSVGGSSSAPDRSRWKDKSFQGRRGC